MMATVFRFGNLIPTSIASSYYLSNSKKFDDSTTDFSEFEQVMRNAAGNPSGYQFATSDAFDTASDCDAEQKRKANELIMNGYNIKYLST